MTGEQILILVLFIYCGAVSVLCWRQDEKIYQLEKYIRKYCLTKPGGE